MLNHSSLSPVQKVETYGYYCLNKSSCYCSYILLVPEEVM